MRSKNLCIQTGWLGYQDYYFNRFSPHIATLSSAANPHHWKEGFITYISYSTKEAATQAMKQFLKSGLAEDVDMRKARRLKAKGIRWELKIRGMSLEKVMEMAQEDLAIG